MTDEIDIRPDNTALLLMDLQVFVVEGFGANVNELISRTTTLLKAARAAGVMVIHVMATFRPGYPEVSPHNLTFGRVKTMGRLTIGDPSTEIHPRLTPIAGEPVVQKRRVSGFVGTELDMILRANGMDTLVLAGISTQGVVLSTQRHASDADYRVIIAHDCCSDTDSEVHRLLVEKVFPRQAKVASAQAVIRALGASEV
jgi:nicotinamidase-related amidase